jgi:hypothetical protein
MFLSRCYSIDRAIKPINKIKNLKNTLVSFLRVKLWVPCFVKRIQQKRDSKLTVTYFFRIKTKKICGKMIHIKKRKFNRF